MKLPYISHNGEIISEEKALVSIEQAEVMYGFGVYETIKVRNNLIYFLPQHIDRLMHSARQLELTHQFETTFIEKAVTYLVSQIPEPSYNLKILLYGAATPEKTELFIIPSAPLYPDRKWYRDGVSLISFEHERWMPQAKTLNMLPSYYLYKKAKEQNCYDALLYDKQGNLREGTRTNVYVLKGTHIVSPQKKDILEGVTMMALEQVIKKSDFTIEYNNIPMETIADYDGMFISSTSTKILPVKSVDKKEYAEISKDLQELIRLFEDALDQCAGDFNKL